MPPKVIELSEVTGQGSSDVVADREIVNEAEVGVKRGRIVCISADTTSFK